MGSIIEVQEIIGGQAICTYTQLTPKAISAAFNSAQPPKGEGFRQFFFGRSW